MIKLSKIITNPFFQYELERNSKVKSIKSIQKQYKEFHDGKVIEEITEENDVDSKWNIENSGNKVVSKRKLNVVLVECKIPQNAGCIARTCAATMTPLHLIRPIGFSTDSKRLKRAGLDFWPYVVIKIHESWKDFYEYFKEQESPKRLLGFTRYATQKYAEPDFEYEEGDWLLFGSEPYGLSKKAIEDISRDNGELLRIPMEEKHVRCLNLSVAMGIGLYEAIRQIEIKQKFKS